MERLYSPWRSRYIASFKKEKKNEQCLFCQVIKERKDVKNLLVARKKHCFVMMNLYPYNSGHLMVIPYTHTHELSKLSEREYVDIMKTISDMMTALKKIMNAEGFNVGANLGRVAGAGIDQHLHFHIVPRWNGDTNFMPVLAETKVISDEMKKTYKELKKYVSKK